MGQICSLKFDIINVQKYVYQTGNWYDLQLSVIFKLKFYLKTLIWQCWDVSLSLNRPWKLSLEVHVEWRISGFRKRPVNNFAL